MSHLNKFQAGVALRFEKMSKYALFAALFIFSFSVSALEIHFLRHGETAWNRSRVMQGSIPYTDLTMRGVRMAEATAEGMAAAGIRYDKIYASNLLRAYRTAEIVAKSQGMSPIVDSRIREMGMGKYEGMRYVKGDYPDDNIKNFFENTGPYVPTGDGAESMDDVAVRLKSFLNEVIKPLEGKADKVLCVAHSFVLKTLVREFAGNNVSEAAKNPLQRNCCVHVLECKNGRFSIKETGRIYYDASEFESKKEPLMVAHRGAGDLADCRPEASRAAYSNAVATVCDVVKLDLRRTRDNVIVMGHCPNLKRTMGWDMGIANADYAQIYEKGRYLEANGKKGAERIVRLDEAIEITRSIPQFWIDFKYFTPEFAENVLQTFAKAGIDRGRLMVATFNLQALEYLKARHPDIRRIRHMRWYGEKGGYRIKGSEKIWKTRSEAMAQVLRESRELGLYGMNVPVEETTPEDIAFFRKGGVKWLSLYFVQNSETAARVGSWDVDAFVTDYVSKARAGFAQGNKAYDATFYGDMQNKDR